MFTLKISKNKFEDLIRKMSIPTGKKDFVYPVIAPLFTKRGDDDFGFLNSHMEWIAKSSQSTVWVRAKGLDVSGIKEPTRSYFVLYIPWMPLRILIRMTILRYSLIQKKKNIFLRAEGRIQLKYLCSVLR